jgi:acetolactate synthase-1/2/3 large subunit
MSSPLDGARRPVVWAGSGALDAGAEVAALASALGAPVFTTYSARGLLAGHPSLVGLPPHVAEAGALWDQADVVVAIGSDLDGMNTMNWRLPQPPAVVVVNVDAADAVKNYRADVVVEGDARECLQLVPAGEEGDARPRWADLDGLRAGALARLRGEHPVELAFLDAFAEAVPDEAVVVADMCVAGYWLAGFFTPAAPRRFQYPMGWGTLGYAFPAAVGAALAPGRAPVVCVCGDGGFLFACGELATVAQENLDLTTVIVDDSAYGMLGLDLHTPDFAALARAFGLPAETVDGLGAEFGEALARHVREPGPSVLVARAALDPPPTTSPRWHRTGPPSWAR